MKKILKLIFGFNLLISALSLFSYLAPFIDPIKSWFFSAIAIFNPWYILNHFTLILFWLFAKKRFALLSLFTLIVGWNSITNIFNFNLGETNQDGLSIMSFNFQNSNYNNVKDQDLRATRTSDYLDFLESQNEVEILCAYEMSYRSTQLIKKAFDFPYKAVYEHKSLGIFSKFEIVDKGLLDFGNRSNNCLWADINMKGDTIRLYAVHFESNQVSKDAEKVLDSGDIQEKATWRSIGQIFNKYGKHSVNRSYQAKELISHKSTSPYPVIICGDFNETPQSHLYNLLSKDMQDSFSAKGSGYGATYAGPIRGLRIDYILADENFNISSHKVIKEKYSDHYPIKSWIKRKP